MATHLLRPPRLAATGQRRQLARRISHSRAVARRILRRLARGACPR